MRAPVIRNDHLEHSRIQLEQNLRNSEAAIQLSSATESEPDSYESGDDLESLEYPRHNTNPTLNEFPSFDRRIRDHFTDEDAPAHGWSYRTGDDYEEGINPYGPESLSTVAHHASAVTLSAGLGGRGARRDISFSGAEYDPERPLNEIIAGVTSKLSIFDADSRSKHLTLETSDPLVAEDTAELDHILDTGARPPLHSRAVRMASPITSGSSSHSDTDHNNMAAADPERPKFSDALRNLALSPKRPRSPCVVRSSSLSPRQQATSSLSRATQRPAMTHVPTPRPQKRTSILVSQAPKTQSHPDVVLQPPTPSQASSKFTRMAHGLAKEIEHEKDQFKASMSIKRPGRTRSTSNPIDNNIFHDGIEQKVPPPGKAHTLHTSTRHRSKIQLPDVTGITNAIDSPVKPIAEYYAYRVEGRIRETENRLLHTLNTVQKKLQQLEEENSISRRRVRELEMELEDCKREVARERTRIIEQEELLKRQQQMAFRTKGKKRAKDINVDTSLLHERYKDAVEEKKALEALITSLRTHLARLTSELSTHRELLTELRTLRDADAATLREKSSEITRLKNKVEKLSGEVEVLRVVVEEGLRERRAAKGASVQFKSDDVEHSGDEESPSEEDEDEDEADLVTETEDAGLSYASAGLRTGAKDRTIRTGRATETQIMNAAEFDEVGSDCSASIDMTPFPHTISPVQSPSPKSKRHRPVPPSMAPDTATLARRASTPDPIPDPEDASDPEDEAGPSIRPITTHTEEDTPTRRRHRAEVEEPFPKIRGNRLERLFFAAPEHDARTCSTCNQRRRESDEHPISHAWRARRAGRSRQGSDEDEGFDEGAEFGHTQNRNRASNQRRERSLQDIGEVRSVARQEGLPPQAIVARIIRELEDDFTHYKSIYIELADQYKDMDAASNVAKRNTLAQHLREVVDVLEQKGDQIASLYDQLSFRDGGGSGSHRAVSSSTLS